jgi:hypothetical protein
LKKPCAYSLSAPRESRSFIAAAFTLLLASSRVCGQAPPAASPATPGAAQQSTPAQGAPSTAGPAASGPPASPESRIVGPPNPGKSSYYGDSLTYSANGDILALGNVRIVYFDTTITADRAEGNFNREIVLSGHTHIEAHGVDSDADAIHFFPTISSYRLDNPRATLHPELFRHQIISPAFVRGGEFAGTNTGYSLGEQIIATTCIYEQPHYELRARSAELIPNKVLILRRVSVIFFGVKLVTLPYVAIPLDRRLHRYHSNYYPEFGHDPVEGYYVRLPYAIAEKGAETLLRLDLTQNLGPGYHIEQEYLTGKQDSNLNAMSNNTAVNFTPITGSTFGSIGQGVSTATAGYGTASQGLQRLGTGLGPNNGGLFSISGFFEDGINSNFNASYRHQQGIGSNNRFGLTLDVQKNSFYAYTNTSVLSGKFDFAHNDAAHGVNGTVDISVNKNDTDVSKTSQISGQATESFTFADKGSNRNSMTYNLTFNRNAQASASFGSLEADLETSFQFQHVSRDYSWTLDANKTVDIESTSGAGLFGTVERLPELQMSTDTINFKDGWLRKFPLHLDLGVGEYSEPGTGIDTDRFLIGITAPEQSLISGRTEVTSGGGFEQRFYGDDSAEFILRDTSRLRQHLGGRSGIDLDYNYQQTQGGSPFQFDTSAQINNLTLEAGYLDDRRFQATVQTGYDFLGISSLTPWQSLSGRIMWHPTPSVRLDSLATYDPNHGTLFAVTNQLMIRGKHDAGFDLTARYDPGTGKFSTVNAQFDTPLGHSWRLAALMLYDGYTGQFQSTNLQLTHTWDCMEASVTYTNAPYAFANQKQFYFSIRLTAFPFFRSFARGSAGEALGPGIGQLY